MTEPINLAELRAQIPNIGYGAKVTGEELEVLLDIAEAAQDLTDAEWLLPGFKHDADDPRFSEAYRRLNHARNRLRDALTRINIEVA